MTAHTEALSYQRKARRAVDGYDGMLYLHRWQTGAQLLVFATHQAAQARASDTVHVVGPTVRTHVPPDRP